MKGKKCQHFLKFLVPNGNVFPENVSVFDYISKCEHDAEERTEKPQHYGDTHVNERDETSWERDEIKHKPPPEEAHRKAHVNQTRSITDVCCGLFLADFRGLRGFTELPGVSGSVLVSAVTQPGLDLTLRESAVLLQNQQITLNKQTQTREDKNEDLYFETNLLMCQNWLVCQKKIIKFFRHIF